MTSQRISRRLWIPVLALLAAAGVNGWNWWARDVTRQYRVMTTGLILICLLVVLFLWGMFLARLSWRGRLRLIGAGVLVAAAAAGSLKMRGVTGDLVPIVTWRWAEQGSELPSAATAATPTAVTQSRVEYSQFLGEERDGIVRGVSLKPDWKAHPPREVWRREVGAGWSSFAIHAGVAITQEQHGEEEAVVAYDLGTGEVRWVQSHTDRYATDIGGEGPRATPTIAGGRVFAMGSNGWLEVMDFESGESQWSKQLLEPEEVPDWGFSGSPLVVGDVVIVNPCSRENALVAFDVRSGERLWSTGRGSGGYSSPALWAVQGVPQILIMNTLDFASFALDDGRRLWKLPWGKGNPSVAQPVVVSESRVVISSGYGIGCAAFSVSVDETGVFSVEEVWRSRSLKAKFANFVHRDGMLYGLDDGILVCVDAATGKRVWKGGRYGHGQLILVDELLLVTTEEGELVLVEATPNGHTELASLQAIGDRAWNSQAFAAPWLLLRNDREAVCYELALVGD